MFQEEQNRGKPNWEHLNDELHVLITVEDTENRATLKLERAVDEVKKLLTVVSLDFRFTVIWGNLPRRWSTHEINPSSTQFYNVHICKISAEGICLIAIRGPGWGLDYTESDSCHQIRDGVSLRSVQQSGRLLHEGPSHTLCDVTR